MNMDMAMATTTTTTTPTPKGGTSSPGAYYVAKPPPPPPGYKAAAAAYNSYNGQGGTAAATPRASSAPRHDSYDDRHQHQHQAAAGARALDGLLLLRAAASAMSFVAVALVASCRHGDWMEFARYPEYRGLLGASVLACVYSAAQALRGFRRMRAAGYGGTRSGLADFAGDQVVAYLLVVASAAALPITLRMRSAVLNVFTDAMTAAISLGFIAFAALALSAMLSALAAAAAQPY